MRKAFSDTLVKVAHEDPSLIFLTADLGFQIFDDFIRLFPDRYINVGVAEAQLINTAVGLALENRRPIAYSIASFATARPFEQIRFGIAYHNLPVMVVGAGGGFTYSKSGVTHHAPDDLSLMGMLPNMSIVSPGSPEEVRLLMPQLLKIDGPSYLRVGKFGEPEIAHPSEIVFGRARKLIDGDKIAVITSGDVVAELYPRLLEYRKSGMEFALYHFHTVKPIDRTCLDEISERYATALVIEESVPQGGVFHEICTWKTEMNSPLRVLRRGAPSSFVMGNPDRNELRRRIGIDAEALRSLLAHSEGGTDSGL